MLDPLGFTWLHAELLLRLVVAAMLGAVLGFEREHADKPTGVRDHVLVSLGAALFVIVSIYGFGDFETGGRMLRDPARVAAQVVTGIGFLGAGVILRTEGAVRGLTTAAGIWITAAIGCTVAVGLYLFAVFTTFVVFAVLYLTRLREAVTNGRDAD